MVVDEKSWDSWDYSYHWALRHFFTFWGLFTIYSVYVYINTKWRLAVNTYIYVSIYLSIVNQPFINI